MRELSMADVESVAGTFGPAGAVAGAIVGAAGYVGYAVVNGGGSMSGLAGAAATGAVGGLVLGPFSFGATVAASSLTFHAGMAGGMVERSLDKAGTNYAENNDAGTNYH
jgi:hypothetical protein